MQCLVFKPEVCSGAQTTCYTAHLLSLLGSDRRCADSRPPHNFTNFELDLCSFYVGGGNGSPPMKPPRRH